MSLNYTLASSEKDFAFISKLNSIKTIRGINNILSQNLSPSRQNLANLRLYSIKREIHNNSRYNNHINELKELYSTNGMTLLPYPTMEYRENLEDTDVYFVSYKRTLCYSDNNVNTSIFGFLIKASSYENAITNFICEYLHRDCYDIYHKKASKFLEEGYVVKESDNAVYYYAFHAIKYSDCNSARLKELVLPFSHDESWQYPDIEKFDVRRGVYKWRIGQRPESRIFYENRKIAALSDDCLHHAETPEFPLLIMLGFSKKELSSYSPKTLIPLAEIIG